MIRLLGKPQRRHQELMLNRKVPQAVKVEMHRSDLDKDETREVDVDCERKLKDILTRKWCVGEMVTARIQKVGFGKIAETGSGFLMGYPALSE